MAYVPSSDTLYVANAGDGSVRLSEPTILKRQDKSSWGTMPTISGSMGRATESLSDTAMAPWR